jgi:hypothetical protein
MKSFKMTPRLWTLVVLALLILLTLSAQPCLAALMWSG